MIVIFYCLVGAGAIVFQSTVSEYFKAWLGARPDAMTLIVVYLGLQRGQETGLIGGFFLGLLQDVLTGGLLGANALGPESAVNVVGTGAITKEAFNLGVKSLLLVSADKALPGPLFERAAAVATASPILELVSLSSLGSIVTEQGVLNAEAVRRLAENKPVAPELTT